MDNRKGFPQSIFSSQLPVLEALHGKMRTAAQWEKQTNCSGVKSNDGKRSIDSRLTLAKAPVLKFMYLGQLRVFELLNAVKQLAKSVYKFYLRHPEAATK